MSSYITLGYRLPSFLSKPLFGDREKFGLEPKENDECWLEWQDECINFYNVNQKQSIGKIVNDAGYSVMASIDLEGKKVLEIGPGDINHIKFWNSKPDCYVIADLNKDMIKYSSQKLEDAGVNFETKLIERGERGQLPFDDEEFDVLVSFYSLEHLYPFPLYLDGMLRVLKKGGTLIGAIPSEGGLGWGIGRYLTTRRWLHSNTNIDPDKIICWEHPNFSDHILKELDNNMSKVSLSYWPIKLPAIDINLIIKFIYKK